MSNETKRDVFEDTVFNIETASPDGPEFARELRQRYSAALPDDLPVIPKAISDAIKFYWTTYGHEKGLTDLLFDLVEPWRIGVEKVVYTIHEDTKNIISCIVM